MAIGKGIAGKTLNEKDIRAIVAEAVATDGFAGERVIVIVPDGTRTAPMPQMFRIFQELIAPKAKQLDYLVALGTHQPMSEEALNKLLGVTAEERKTTFAKTRILNHEWAKPGTFKTIGTIPEAEVARISGGRLKQAVDVSLNKVIFDYDRVLICGPVFPHEVAGFSGGNKYFFPGIGGPEVINLTHWLGALITNYEVIGTRQTPIREIIDRAASFIEMKKSCFAMVVKGHDLAGLYYGAPETAWKAAVDLSEKEHIVYVEQPYKQILSVMPQMYDDIWTAGKGMYKMEPVAADGGEVIIYAPHIDEISYTHGKVIEEVGYHVRDYFSKQWDRFKKYPWGVLAHSTHVRGAGTYENGVEKPRVQVTLATKIPEARCRRINLGYRDPASIDPKAFQGREKDGVLYVPKAGEMLYRVKKR